MLVTSWNPTLNFQERSFLSNSASAGEDNLVLKNTDRFAAGNRILVGEMGHEKAEIVSVVTVDSTTGLTVTPLVFAHSADEPVYVLRYDQVRFYRSTTGISGEYSVISTQALDVDNETLTTAYDDPLGVSTYYYRVDYYNSITTSVSSLSDPVLGTGYPRGSAGFLIDEILKEVGDTEQQYVSRPEIMGWFNEVNDDLITRTKKPYRFLHTRAAEDRVADATTLAFPSLMYKFDRMDYVFTDTNGDERTAPIDTTPFSLFRQNYGDGTSQDASDDLQTITIDTATSVFRLFPRSLTAGTNKFYIYYWKFPTEIDSEGDLFETDTPRVYKLYAMHKFYLKKAAADPSQLNIANVYETKYEREVAKLPRGNRLDQGTPQSFRFPGSQFNRTSPTITGNVLVADDGSEIIIT